MSTAVEMMFPLGRCDSCGAPSVAFAYGGIDLDQDIEDGVAVYLCESCAGAVEVAAEVAPDRELRRVTIAHGKVLS